MLLKICGLTLPEDVLWLDKQGIDLLGFIFYSPSPRCTDWQVVAPLKTKAKKVGVVVDLNVAQIKELWVKADLDLIQLHGEYGREACKDLAGIDLIKVFWPERYACIQELRRELDRFLPYVKYFLFDAGKSKGGHGRSIAPGKWTSLLADYPVFLAGGIGPENVKEFLKLGPLGLDLNSGVELAPGIKDKTKILTVLKVIKEQ